MPELVTPTVDALVNSGTSLSNFYCASPVCSPARASLLTGRMPSAHGIHDWLVGERHPDAHEDVYLGGLPNLPEVLKRAGYTCAMTGKWHVGTSRRPAPGFDYWYAHRLGGGPYYNAPIWDKNGEKAEEPRYFTYAVADEARTFLDQYSEGHSSRESSSHEPFFLQVNFTAPHDPWIKNHPQDLYDLYKDCDFESIPREPPHPWVAPRRDDFKQAFENPLPHIQGYAAALSGVDRALESLISKLKEHGLDENTVIIYMADNGFSCGHHGTWGKGNGTYPLNFWENSVRVPFVIKMPGQTEKHEITNHVSATSFFPTICDLAHVEAPEDPLRAGASFAKLLVTGHDDPLYDSVMVFDEYGGGRMVRSGEYKLIERFEGPGELYNLDNDPEERENLYDVSDYSVIQLDLHDRLSEWFEHHETLADRAYERGVRGRGQINPPRKGYDDAHTYVQQDITFDGTRH
ncbi:MAG: sulfatase-like hydrolase/transferase [Bifidobacteriaceae bacterium]|nr:sulfatase-like hydrolase/transferase [Bifidobacteriaceae bacterium]